jgi:GT2 family glycosyltransferase
LSRSSSPFNKQNELVRALRKQLAATERELAGQKWVLDQFLQSPSWRLTYPIRWIAKQARALRDWLTRLLGSRPMAPAAIDSEITVSDEPAADLEIENAVDLKQLFTDLRSIELKSFLISGSTLDLPRHENPDISVIVVVFNRAELTFACLRSLVENHHDRIEVIIVDNASQDDTPLLIERLRGAHIIRNTENRNFLLAVNQAAKEAHGEHLLLLNNDAQVLPGTLEQALRTMRSAADIGAVGGRLILLDGSLQEAGSIIWRDGSCMGYGRGDNPFAPMYMFQRDVDYCSGAFLLTPRRVWEELGGFDELFKPAYYEETDYCTRVWQHNLRVVYDPNCVLLHYEFASAQSTTQATDLQREHQRIFAARHQALLSNYFAPDVNSVLAARMKDRGRKKVLFIDDRVPHAWLGSGFPRARNIIMSLLKQDCFVTFYPLSEFEEDWISVYSDMPRKIEFMMGYGPPLLEPFLRNRVGYYDAIFISRPHNMEKLKPIHDAHPDWFDSTSIIYDAEAVFATREITFRQLNGPAIDAEEIKTLVRDEVRLASAADCVVAVAAQDAEHFRQEGLVNVRVIGHCLDPVPTPRSFDERKGFLFVGAIHEETSPNGDSVIWFVEHILPKIRAELGEDVPFVVAGVNRSERVQQFASSTVSILGQVPDLTPLYDAARVFVAPTRYAAGIPHKVHEAAAKGIPIVATPLLASQLSWADRDPILVGQDADTFAKKCVELYTNPELWTALREVSLQKIVKECSVKTFEANVAAVVAVGKSRDYAVGRNI